MLKNLKQMRENAGVTQKAVAEAIGVSQQSINKYENHNIEPDIETLIRLAQYFHCTVDQLIGYYGADLAAMHQFTEEEIGLLNAYRHLNRLQKAAIRTVIDSYKK